MYIYIGITYIGLYSGWYREYIGIIICIYKDYIGLYLGFYRDCLYLYRGVVPKLGVPWWGSL